MIFFWIFTNICLRGGFSFVTREIKLRTDWLRDRVLPPLDKAKEVSAISLWASERNIWFAKRFNRDFLAFSGQFSNQKFLSETKVERSRRHRVSSDTKWMELTLVLSNLALNCFAFNLFSRLIDVQTLFMLRSNRGCCFCFGWRLRLIQIQLIYRSLQLVIASLAPLIFAKGSVGATNAISLDSSAICLHFSYLWTNDNFLLRCENRLSRVLFVTTMRIQVQRVSTRFRLKCLWNRSTKCIVHPTLGFLTHSSLAAQFDLFADQSSTNAKPLDSLSVEVTWDVLTRIKRPYPKQFHTKLHSTTLNPKIRNLLKIESRQTSLKHANETSFLRKLNQKN